MPVDVLYLLAGGALFLAVVLPRALERWWVSSPIVLIVVGALVGRFLALPDGVVVDPVRHRAWIEHITEITVLVSLMGVGLALDRPLSLRSWTSWRSWGATWKLLGVAMPLCIGAMTLLAMAMGIPAAPALLLAAAMAPTDPVLASEVQVEGPGVVDVDADDDISEDDEVRFALTSEAGLNDGLAFPFVYAAMLLVSAGSVTQWGLGWLGWHVVGKTVLGVLAGIVVGWVLARVSFRARVRALRLAEHGEPLVGIAALLLAYGAAEVINGWGFLAVFACAMTMRSADRAHDFHADLHSTVEQLELPLTLFVLLMVGVGLAEGTLAHLDWRGVVLALALVLVVRPLAGLFALNLGRWRLTTPDRHRVIGHEQIVTAFFGVRGVGSLYYLAYALGHVAMPQERWLWSTATFTIVVSVVVHGVLATPVLAWLESRRDRAARVA